jgi:hypothetical protein
VPELKEMGVKSFIIFDKRKPPAPIAAEFLEMVRKRDSIFRNDNKKVRSAALSLSEKKAHSTKMSL